MKILTTKHIGGGEVMRAVLLAMPDLILSGGHRGHWLPVNNNAPALYIKYKGAIIAFLVYRIEEDIDCFIDLGWVAKEHRRQGLYSSLEQRLCEIAKKKKLRRCVGSYMDGNEPMRQYSLKRGRKVLTHYWEKPL